MTQRLPIGVKRVLAWRVGADGYALGTLGDDVANGVVAGAYVLPYPKSVGYSIADAETADQTGGDRRIARVPISDRPADSFPLEVADSDSEMWVMSTGGAVDDTNTNFVKYSANPANEALNSLGLGIQQQFYSASRVGSSSRYWLTDIFLNVTAEPKEGPPTERQFTSTQFRILPNYSDTDFTGEALSAASGMEPSEGLLDRYRIESPSPLHIVSYKQPGTASATFQLPYKPLSTDVLVTSGNWFFRNGVAEPLTSITLAGIATYAAGAIGDVLTLIYLTNYVPAT